MTGARPRIAVPGMSSAKIQGLRFSGTVVANAVIAAVVRAGGEPVVVSPADAEHDYRSYDGIVLPGGSDIAPERYGQEPAAEVSRTDAPGQDDADARAIRAAIEHGIPALLICRGMQLLNVERGGTLVQHLDSSDAHIGTVHDVEVEEGSLLADVLGTTALDVSSYHHQAIDRVGEGLRVVARGAGDGVVEAVELEGSALVAIQWHPEDRAATLDNDQRLFDWLVERARERADARGERRVLEAAAR